VLFRSPLLAGFGRQALHAFRLGLIHPSSNEFLHWFSPLPEDFSSLLRALDSRRVNDIDMGKNDD
jgi:23S rRNA pseudouridine1911/1915/1917 synthase